MKRLALIFLGMLLGIAQLAAQSIQPLLCEVEGVRSVRQVESSRFGEKYVLEFEQPVDYEDPSAGTFRQRVFIGHVHPDSATVVVTEGYLAQYAASPSYREEISDLFNTNMVVIEHRFFAESVPEHIDWDDLNAVYAAHDHHNVVTALKKIYKGKWIADGISKGGQTSLIYRAYYPDDVDITVPYVAPLCRGVEDGRHETFLAEYVGTQAQRDSLLDFQIDFLKRREGIMPLLDSLSRAENIVYNRPLDEIYDYMVLEFPFAVWQWGTPVSSIPSADASDREYFDYMTGISHPSYFTNQGPTAPFFVQAAKELGYYGYDVEPLRDYLTISSAEGYLAQMMLPDGYRPAFSDYIYRKCSDFLKDTDAKILFIYGEYDPWTAVRVPDTDNPNIHIFMDPKGSHRARISTFPDDAKAEIMAVLSDWLYN